MNLGVGFLVMEMLGSLERSGLQIHMVFDAEVYFLKMVVGVLLPPRHDDLQMFLDQLQRFFFRLRVDKYVIKET